MNQMLQVQVRQKKKNDVFGRPAIQFYSFGTTLHSPTPDSNRCVSAWRTHDPFTCLLILEVGFRNFTQEQRDLTKAPAPVRLAGNFSSSLWKHTSQCLGFGLRFGLVHVNPIQPCSPSQDVSLPWNMHFDFWFSWTRIAGEDYASNWAKAAERGREHVGSAPHLQ